MLLDELYESTGLLTGIKFNPVIINSPLSYAGKIDQVRLDTLKKKHKFDPVGKTFMVAFKDQKSKMLPGLIGAMSNEQKIAIKDLDDLLDNALIGGFLMFVTIIETDENWFGKTSHMPVIYSETFPGLYTVTKSGKTFKIKNENNVEDWFK